MSNHVCGECRFHKYYALRNLDFLGITIEEWYCDNLDSRRSGQITQYNDTCERWAKEQTMRLIDADKLKKDIARLHALNDEAEIRRAYEYNPHVTSTDFEETLVSVFDAIDDAPSIDIVRCQDCKHWNMVSNGCMRNPSVEGWQADDFCSYGERKGQ